MHRYSRIGRVLTLALATIVLSGCIAVGGSDNLHEPTLGKQLIDLKTARDTGAINEDEYCNAKNDLLHGPVRKADTR